MIYEYYQNFNKNCKNELIEKNLIEFNSYDETFKCLKDLHGITDTFIS